MGVAYPPTSTPILRVGGDMLFHVVIFFWENK